MENKRLSFIIQMTVFSFLIVLLGCNNVSNVKEYFFQSKIDSLKTKIQNSELNEIHVNFIYIIDSVKWDSIFVVRSFMIDRQLRNMKFSNYSSIEDEVNLIKSVDWYYGLFFVKDGNYVGYTKLHVDPTFRDLFTERHTPIILKSDAVLLLRRVKMMGYDSEVLYFTRNKDITND